MSLKPVLVRDADSGYYWTYASWCVIHAFERLVRLTMLGARLFFVIFLAVLQALLVWWFLQASGIDCCYVLLDTSDA